MPLFPCNKVRFSHALTHFICLQLLNHFANQSWLEPKSYQIHVEWLNYGSNCTQMPGTNVYRARGTEANPKPGQGVTEAETLIRPKGQRQKPIPAGQRENEKKH